MGVRWDCRCIGTEWKVLAVWKYILVKHWREKVLLSLTSMLNECNAKKKKKKQKKVEKVSSSHVRVHARVCVSACDFNWTCIERSVWTNVLRCTIESLFQVPWPLLQTLASRNTLRHNIHYRKWPFSGPDVKGKQKVPSLALTHLRPFIHPVTRLSLLNLTF